MPSLQFLVYYSRVMYLTGLFEHLQSELHSLGGQKEPSGMLGRVPPNLTSSWEGLQYSKRGSGTFQSKRLIFSMVSGSRKFLTTFQIMEMEVVILTLQPAKRRARQLSARKVKAFLRESSMEKRPWRPESTRAIQFSTCPGMRQCSMTYSSRQIWASSTSTSVHCSATIFSTLQTMMGRQCESFPPTQKIPSPCISEAVPVAWRSSGRSAAPSPASGARRTSPCPLRISPCQAPSTAGTSASTGGPTSRRARPSSPPGSPRTSATPPARIECRYPRPTPQRSACGSCCPRRSQSRRGVGRRWSGRGGRGRPPVAGGGNRRQRYTA